MLARHRSAGLLLVSLGTCALAQTPAVMVAPQAPAPAFSGAKGPHNAALLTALTTQLTQQQLHLDAILLGEQHDVPEHQQLHHSAVQALSDQRQLAALVIEMAEQGQTTLSLGPQAGESTVRAALQWNNDAWPWPAYGPAIMAAVRAGVPVLGANLPRTQMRDAMKDPTLDERLTTPARNAQQQAIRLGHCNLLPESQIAPMARIQIARDRAMATTVQQASMPGKTVLLLAGHGHVNRQLGVPQHLPQGFRSQAILLLAAPVSGTNPTGLPFDITWALGTAPQTDYCAAFSASQPKR